MLKVSNWLFLYEEYLQQNCMRNCIVDGIVVHFKRAKKRSVENIMPRAYLFATMEGKFVQHILK